MSIKDFGEKIKGVSSKEQGKDLFIVITLLVVAFASFGLGRLSIGRSEASTVSLVYPRGEAAAASALLTTPETSKSNTKSISSSTVKGEGSEQSATLPKQIVASSRGTKYYYVWCSGAKSLSEANKVYFETEAEAEAKGYTKSTSCK